MGLLAARLGEMGSLFVFTFFADVKTFNRAMVAHHAGVNQTFGPQLRIVFKNRIQHSFHDFEVCGYG